MLRVVLELTANWQWSIGVNFRERHDRSMNYYAHTKKRIKNLQVPITCNMQRSWSTNFNRKRSHTWNRSFDVVVKLVVR